MLCKHEKHSREAIERKIKVDGQVQTGCSHSGSAGGRERTEQDEDVTGRKAEFAVWT